jgi:DNA-binding CsgD family transcriptional regulator
MLLGRVEELARLDGLLAVAREGRSAVVVVRGAPGIGKSALLEYVVGSAAGFQVVRAAGVESEMELAFAAVHQICSPILSGLARLPAPQRVGLETAFGLSAGDPPDPFFVGLGVLSLLSDAAAAGRPLLCVVDDVQWLDRASALALGVVARRLEADAVALVLAARDSVEMKELSGLEELRLDGLSASVSRRLLSSVLPGQLDTRVVDRILAETEGNPLALIELPRGMSAAELAGGFGLLETLGLPGRIEESFRRRLEPLPAETRRLLLVAAAEPSGDAALMWQACARLGVDPEAAGAAEDEDLIHIDSSVRFFHPLVRSAVYRSASAKDRRRSHGALAEVIDPVRDPDRRAWHRAQATVGPDEEVAAELERSAQRAQARGGVAAAAAFLERSVALTLDAGSRSVRALAAAEARNQAGGYDRALELVTLAEAGALDEIQRAQADRLRGLIIFARSDRRDGASYLLRAAQALAPLDEALSRTALIEALQTAGESPTGASEEVGRALLGLRESEPPDPTTLLLRGYGALFVHGFPNGLDLIRQAVEAFRLAPFRLDEHPYVLNMAANASLSFWDDAGWDELSSGALQLARDAGAVGQWLPQALDARAGFLASAGELSEANASLDEADAVKAATGVSTRWSGGVRAIGLREGGTGVCESMKRELREDFDETRPSAVASDIEGSLAMLYNGLGQYRDAFEAGIRSRERSPVGGTGQGLAELIEAAGRCDEGDVALGALQALTARTQLGGTDWALGVEACSRALVSDDATAGNLYQEAIDRLARTRMRLPLARAHLLYGEWLRRENRRVDARQQLRTAHDMFDDMGATSFAARARHELSATGVTARSRRDATLDQLTPQEERIAKMAGQGLSDADIASQLYISKATVDYHLRKVFRKLGVRSRSQLANKTTHAAAHG